MSAFVVISSTSERFISVVLATGVDLPHADIAEVEAELRRRRICGDVVFDLLTCNASRTRRFFCRAFDGERFLPIPRLKLVDPESGVREASADYMFRHKDQFNFTLLTPAMRFAAERGLVL